MPLSKFRSLQLKIRHDGLKRHSPSQSPIECPRPSYLEKLRPISLTS